MSDDDQLDQLREIAGKLGCLLYLAIFWTVLSILGTVAMAILPRI